METMDETNHKILEFETYEPTVRSQLLSSCQDEGNITVNQSWRSRLELNSAPKEILLKVKKNSILRYITFGKEGKTPICALKRFKIYGGITEDCMIELLEGALNSEDKDEAFMLKNTLSGNSFACRYVKIVPLQSWGVTQTMNIFSLELIGIDDWCIVQSAMDCVKKYAETQSIRLCLKYMRRMNFMDSFNSLKRESQIEIEHPSLEQLYNLIKEGDYVKAEEFVMESSTEGLFNNYMSSLVYYPTWINLELSKPRPGMRGGHQMCVDESSGIMYLLGGWDGYQDINDFWAFDILNNSWAMISQDTRLEGGPGPRSCHKMCIDSDNGLIYVLGRYLDLQSRNEENLKSDFYMYSTVTKKWTLISHDTQADGGPQLIYDHQMCIDIRKQIIYVFGGKILIPGGEIEKNLQEITLETTNDNVKYSGLFSYDIASKVWTLLCRDVADQETDPSAPTIRSRIGHSTLFHPVTNKLYIFAGHRNKTYLNDFFSYNIDTKKIEYINKGCQKYCNNFPASGFTQRATLDSNLNEIYVLSGFSKERLDNSLHNTFWAYSITKDEWTCLYTSEKITSVYWHREQYIEPCPRFAHQLVYDSVNKVHFLFGGNPGILRLPRIRLDDLWKLSFNRPTSEEVLNHLRLLIRKARYRELVHVNKVAAISYLQREVNDLVSLLKGDHQKELQHLVEIAFQDCKTMNEDECIHAVRIQLFEKLCTFYPEDMAQPRENIVGAIRF